MDTGFKKIGFAIGVAGFAAIVLFVELDSANHAVTTVAACAFMMAVFWITECIPIAATSLLPLVLFPLLGIESTEKIAPTYMNSTVFLFIGGFLIALAMERWNLHKRIALGLIVLIGRSPALLVLAFMSATAFISMWISNTATAMMMLPVGLAIIKLLEDEYTEPKTHTFAISLLLGIAYSSSIGGITTLIGTAPNLAFLRIFKILFPEAPVISFGSWLLLMLPITIMMLFGAWFILTKMLYKPDRSLQIDRRHIKEEYRKLGHFSYEEKIVSVVFGLTALLWIFRVDLDIGAFVIPGWSALFPFAKYIDDGTIGIAMGSLLFFLPTKSSKIAKDTIITNEVFGKIPWDVILLFGGGFALAKGFVASGLSLYIGNQLSFLGNISPFAIVALIALLITFLTELTSNTATAEMILPVLGALSVTLGVNPLLFMITATVSVSMAFMLPVATPPNAIVFGARRMHVGDMARPGLLLNFLGVVVISLVVYLLGQVIFNIDVTQAPAWAIQKTP